MPKKLTTTYRSPLELRRKQQLAKRESDKTRASRWGVVLAKTKFTELANGFLDHYAKIKVDGESLNSSDAMFIIHLMRFKWDQHPPHPGYDYIAHLMGLTVPAVRKIAKKLERMNLVERVPKYKESLDGKKGRQEGNYFRLDGLFRALEELILLEQPGLQ